MVTGRELRFGRCGFAFSPTPLDELSALRFG
jgi:hypothetical protein